RTIYDHLSTRLVSLNAVVGEGSPIGLSGQTGCARGPHLHFEVQRVTGTNSGQPTPIDPFGWQNRNGADPWKAAANGAESIMLWKASQVPERRLTVSQPIPSGFNAGITSVAWMGDTDSQRPNNEEVVLTFNGGPGDVFRIAELRGDRSGLRHVFATQPTISAARPRLHLYTGTGTNRDTVVYLGRSTPIWDNNFNDCARIVFANGNQVRMNLGNGC
ncbi:MAG: M23 family metallopeptidase, partial [Gemmatimonadales bacterium]